MKALREDRFKLEGRLEHSQKMESLGRLAAGVAHDFNNVLTVIQGHLGLLRSEPNLRPETSESLQQMAQATERATKLIRQLLSFTREQTAPFQCVDLNEVLTDMSLLLHRTLGEDVAVQHNYAPELPPIQGDRTAIERAVLDLALQARESMPAGGQLVISTATLEIDAAYLARRPEARKGHFVCLSVIDTGFGMESQELGRMLQPAEADKDPHTRANCLFSTVSGIVTRHQGWLEVQSRVGQGSTFRLYFPVSTAEEATQKRAGRLMRRGNETILVVEDEPPVLWITRNILEHHGYHVLEANSGMEALAIWHQHQNEIALLLTDVVMPVGVSGQELAEQFQQQKPGLKVIYTSGYSAAAAVNDLELVQGLNFLQKPYHAERLTAAVRDCLDAR